MPRAATVLQAFTRARCTVHRVRCIERTEWDRKLHDIGRLRTILLTTTKQFNLPPDAVSKLLRQFLFFFRHFQRWLPRFFQAREPRFMRFPDLPPVYQRYGRDGWKQIPNQSNFWSGRYRIRTRVSGLEGHHDIQTTPIAQFNPRCGYISIVHSIRC